MPQLRLPKPPALSTLYSYLHCRKIKILELFHKVDQGKHQISREEFIVALKAVSASPAGLSAPTALRHYPALTSPALFVQPDWNVWLNLSPPSDL